MALHTQLVPKNHVHATTSISEGSKYESEHILHGDVKADRKEVRAACKSCAFSVDGTRLFSGGSAGDLVGVDADRAMTFTAENRCDKNILWRIEGATEGRYNPVTVIKPFEGNQSLLATGDDNGGIRIWDQRICTNWSPSLSSDNAKSEKKRQKKKKNKSKPPRPPGCIRSWNEHDDYISAIEISQDENTLLATSADCRLGVYDLRMPGQVVSKDKKPASSFRLSDDQEDELLSLQIMKNGKKVVCGTQEGVLSVFSWGTWGDVSDRFPGHPQSVDALLKVDEDTLLTGSSDGRIRVVQIQPDKLLGVIGDNHGGFPIEKLCFNANRHLVGSLTHSNFIRLWDAKMLLDESDSDDEDSDNESDEGRKMPAKQSTTAAAAPNGSDDDWDDMDAVGDSTSDEDSDSDSDDSDEAAETVNDRRKKRFKTENEKFFADL
jgi:WD40 repeat protein